MSIFRREHVRWERLGTLVFETGGEEGGGEERRGEEGRGEGRKEWDVKSRTTKCTWTEEFFNNPCLKFDDHIKDQGKRNEITTLGTVGSSRRKYII